MPFTAGSGSNAQYTVEAQRANMKKWLGADPYMSKHRGEYFDRYSDNMPFENHIDVHFGQKFNFNVGRQRHSLELVADIINFANMLNPSWGRSYGMGINSYFNPIIFNKGSFQFYHPGDYQMFSLSDYYSRWKLQLGLRYSF